MSKVNITPLADRVLVEPAPAEPEIVKQEVAEPVKAEADNLTVTNDVA